MRILETSESGLTFFRQTFLRKQNTLLVMRGGVKNFLTVNHEEY